LFKIEIYSIFKKYLKNKNIQVFKVKEKQKERKKKNRKAKKRNEKREPGQSKRE
jgi:hypothetical protein